MNPVRVSLLLAVGGALLGGAAAAADGVVSGLAIGTPTASIPVVDVTGPFKGQRICYVCDFQEAPNVLAFFRDTGDETAQLIVELNELYLRHKDEGFKAVVMVVAGPDASPWLERLNQSAAIAVPLTVFRKGPADVAARLYELNPEVANTFLMTVDRAVVANVAGIGPGEFGRVAQATEQMLGSRVH